MQKHDQGRIFGSGKIPRLNPPYHPLPLHPMYDSLKRILPVLDWLPHYHPADLRFDLLAGLTLAFFVVPTSMAYATLAGLPPQTGIYCYLFAGLLYFWFGTSRHLAIGPTSAMSVLLASSLGSLAGETPAAMLTDASFVALAMAGMFLVAWIVRLSALINFISDTVLTGFKAGAALVIASTQLPKLFGLTARGDTFFERTGDLFRDLGSANFPVLLFGGIALALLVAGNKLFRGKPVSLVLVIASIPLLTFTDLSTFGIRVIGQIPKGIPWPGIPVPSENHVNELLALALGCFFLSYVESMSAARAIARRRGYEVDPRSELLALGAANLASSVGGGFAVAGGLSQSTVNERSGARSLLSLLFTSATLAVILIFMTGLMKNLPEVILAVILLEALTGLISIGEMKHLYRVSKLEFLLMLATIAAVLVFGILQGILVAGLHSIVSILTVTSSPHIAILGRIPGTSLFSDLLRHPDNETVPGILIVRPESPILYYNVPHIREHIREILVATRPKPELMVIDLSSANYVDASGARYLMQLEEDLENSGIKLRVVEALGSVRDTLRAEGLENEIGHISRKVSIQDILEEFRPEK